MGGIRGAGTEYGNGYDPDNRNNITEVKLEEQDRRFAADENRPVEGVIRLRRRHRLAEIEIEIRNLKQIKQPYRIFFIGRSSGSSVYRIAGNIEPDRRGNGSVRIMADPSDFDGKGTDLSCFYIFMIAAAGEPVKPVLRGDMPEKDTGEIREGASDKKEPAGITGTKVYNSYYKEVIKQKIAVLREEYEYSDNTSPFGDEWLSYEWKRVDDIMKFPVASAGAEKQILKYGHFIISLDGTKLYLGVPGRHCEEDWPDRGKSGFTLWQSIRTSDEYGYWCMVIDWKNGIITEIS